MESSWWRRLKSDRDHKEEAEKLLLWALLLHASITSRPVEFNFIASVLLSIGDPDTIDVHNC